MPQPHGQVIGSLRPQHLRFAPEVAGRPLGWNRQGFPDDWEFSGKKTKAYRQVGNAFPPPVAKAMGRQLLECIGTAQLALMEA